MRSRERAYVALGGNLGDAQRTLANGVAALAALPGADLRGVSRLYRTRPVGVIDQPDFLNAVAALDVPAGPDPATGALALLEALKGIEQAFGRQPRERWGPRELDLDLIAFGPHCLSAQRANGQWLEVPHPLAVERLFVLAPLADLAPALVPPGWSDCINQARRRREEVERADAVQPVGEWQPAVAEWLEMPNQNAETTETTETT